MNRVSKKHELANMDAAERRAVWRLGRPRCCAICRVQPHTETHHIAGRNAKRPDLYEHPWNWLEVCNDCHARYDKESPALTVCLAKWRSAPEEFSLANLVRRIIADA